ncbi:MAG: hypothetical protein LKE37_11050 [Atopobiaceae bacterium]|jgi:dCTP deaminase|nr:hypothetical protein [Atopobiaceae bacterium]
MVLSDRDIKAELASGRIVIDPLVEANVQPASVDVRLGSNFRVFRNSTHTCIDPLSEQPDLTESIDVPEGETFVLHPGQFALGTTLRAHLRPRRRPRQARGESRRSGASAS